MKIFKIFGVFCSLIFVGNCQVNLIKIREWKKLDFKFPSEEIRNESLSNGKWVPENALTIDVDIDYFDSMDKPKIFTTIPRFSSGVPITLGYLGKNSDDLQIIPYPDYSWQENQGTNCDRFTSVIRVAIDQCGKLWVLDTGKIGEEQKCPPQIFIFNLRNNQLLRNYKFPSSQYVAESLFIVPVVDVKNSANNCRNAKVYISDVTGYALLVYDFARNTSWRIKNPLFISEPAYYRFYLAGEPFDLPDGLFGLALSPKNEVQRKLYFHALASGKENTVPLSLIDNPNIWTVDENARPSSFKTIGNRRNQTASQAMDKYGNLFFVLTDPMAVACWDSSTPYNRDNIKILYQNNQTLQFASGLKIKTTPDQKEELWISTPRLQKIYNGNQNFDEVNFRIMKQRTKVLLRGKIMCNGIPYSRF